jgi:hypothetical protein
MLGSRGWWLTLSAALVASAVFTFSRGYRIVVRIERDRAEVILSWLWLRYRSRTFELDTIRVESAGTGDCGFPGDWPISELCELSGRVLGSHRRVYVGPASAHREITRALNAQLARLKTPDAA